MKKNSRKLVVIAEQKTGLDGVSVRNVPDRNEPEVLIGLCELETFFNIKEFDDNEMYFIAGIAWQKENSEGYRYLEDERCVSFPLHVKSEPEKLWLLSDVIEWYRILVLDKSLHDSCRHFREFLERLGSYPDRYTKEQLIINYVKSVRTGIYESVFAVLCGHFVKSLILSKQ